jgi:pyrroline-5-carboxylate reductase
MKILFLGGGNMAGAMIGGLAGKLYAAADIGVIEIDAGARERLARQWGVQVLPAAAEPVRQAQVVVLAVKPQQLREAVAAAKPFLANPLVISIAAGIRGSDLAGWLGSERIVRCMPNTPALVGAGITGAAALAGATEADRETADRILQAVGEVVWLKDEGLLDAVTAVSGSGPAYVFYFIEAMVEAGVRLGLDEAAARQLAQATFAGAARLATQSPDSLATLREKVTSKGGTTAAALDSLARDGVADAIGRAVQAAHTRAGELAEQFGRS